MGLFDKLKQGLASVHEEHERLFVAGSLGAVPVPGTAVIELPAGTVSVIFEHNQPERGGEQDDRYWKFPEIEVQVRGPAGSVELRPDTGYNAVTIGDGRLHRSSWGKLEVPTAGGYEVGAKPLDDWYLGAGIEPRLLFDAAP